MRVLYIPNEHTGFPQLGFRRAFTNLKDARLIEDVSVFSLQMRVENNTDSEIEIQNLFKRIAEFKPDVVFMHKPAATGLRQRHLAQLRRAHNFRLIYHEADPYRGPLHPLPFASRAVAKFSDVVFTVGSGEFARNFRRAGAKDVRYVPWCFEQDRVQVQSPLTESDKTHDVVLIANRNTPRWRGLPNWKDRIRFVELLQTRFGERLALYGRNWSGISAMGPCDFHTQSLTIKTGWISANWDHFSTEPKYFSDRLPISLASGSVHATTFHRGYEDLFPKNSERFLILGRSPEHLVDSIEERLTTTSKLELLEAGREARTFAEQNFRQDRWIVNMLNFDGVHIDPKKAELVWDAAAPPTSEI